MRRGRVFKRCARCGARVTEKRCTKVVDGVRCNGSFSWAYVIDMNSPGAKRRQQRRGGFKTKEEATDAMNRAQVQRADGTYVEPQKLTVGEYLNDWATAGFGGVRPWTRRGYAVVVRVHLVPRIGEVRLQTLSRLQVKALYAQLRENGFARLPSADRIDQLRQIAVRYQELRSGPRPRAAVRLLVEETGRPEATIRHWIRRCSELGLLGGPPKAGGKGLSPKSVWNVHVCLRAALNDAIEDGLLRTNPAKGAMKPPKGRKRMKTWSKEEMLAFLTTVGDERNFALFYVALYTGMRRGELLGLRWEDIRWNTRTISVQTQAGIRDGEEDDEYELLEDAPTKSPAGKRAIKVDAPDIEVLKRHRAAQQFERRSWADAYRDEGLVFCRPDGSPHNPDSITSEFERLVKRSGLKRIRFHDMRHTHATLLLESGVDVSVVSKRLGHASVKTTADLYVHVTERLQAGAAERFSAYLAERPSPTADRTQAAQGIGGADESQRDLE